MVQQSLITLHLGLVRLILDWDTTSTTLIMVYVGTAPPLGQDRFLPNLFQLINNPTIQRHKASD
jgi:hypothetical protein